VREVRIRTEYANLTALVEELDSVYGRHLLSAFSLEGLLRGKAAHIILDTMLKEVLKSSSV
jgi:hypothetical protein